MLYDRNDRKYDVDKWKARRTKENTKYINKYIEKRTGKSIDQERKLL